MISDKTVEAPVPARGGYRRCSEPDLVAWSAKWIRSAANRCLLAGGFVNVSANPSICSKLILKTNLGKIKRESLWGIVLTRLNSRVGWAKPHIELNGFNLQHIDSALLRKL